MIRTIMKIVRTSATTIRLPAPGGLSERSWELPSALGRRGPRCSTRAQSQTRRPIRATSRSSSALPTSRAFVRPPYPTLTPDGCEISKSFAREKNALLSDCLLLLCNDANDFDPRVRVLALRILLQGLHHVPHGEQGHGGSVQGLHLHARLVRRLDRRRCDDPVCANVERHAREGDRNRMCVR